MIGLIKAARRDAPSCGPFQPCGRTQTNGKIIRFSRQNGLQLKVPPPWRDLDERGQRCLTSGLGVGEMLDRIEISREHWTQIVDVCSVRVVAFPVS